mmetsp:Transcript_50021/g.119010  ORF Transcript_50021/g.119010 Transcript_50021/m.119010 type:complete len:406 (-) Transcript_50021:87-1304(-)
MEGLDPACTDQTKERNLEEQTTAQLKLELKRRKISLTGCLERQDLINALREDNQSRNATSTNGSASSASSTCSAINRDVISELPKMPVAELKKLLIMHGALHKVTGAVEKSMFVEALVDSVLRCPVCLCEQGASEDGGAEAEPTWTCSSCMSPFHRQCAAGHALAAADAGRLPLLCPVPGCGCRWPKEIVAWALNQDELQRYNTAVRNVREMRGAAGGGSGIRSPRTKAAFESLGIKICPRCGAGVEKQSGNGMIHGCDKMTCRCGCRFCYVCGMEADSSGMARCSCVGAHHSFLSHESVMNNYADMNFGQAMANGFQAFAPHLQGFAAHVANGTVPQFGPGNTQQFAGNFPPFGAGSSQQFSGGNAPPHFGTSPAGNLASSLQGMMNMFASAGSTMPQWQQRQM